jgi:hypothetical protein
VSTTSTNGLWYIYYERAYEIPQQGILISTPMHIYTKIQYSHENAYEHITGFWYIFERAHEHAGFWRILVVYKAAQSCFPVFPPERLKDDPCSPTLQEKRLFIHILTDFAKTYHILVMRA